MSDPPALPHSRPAWKTPLLVFGIILLVVVAAAGILWWWINRPISPVTLAPPEQQVLERKLDVLSGDPPEFAIAPGTVVAAPDPGEEPYEPGDKTIILTQRELNGLLAMNGLGDQVRITLGKDAVITRVNTTIPEDFPVMAGKKFKARARFFVKDDAGLPALILDDITVWGISLPNAWLGDLKGENLFEVISPTLHDNIISRGIDDVRIGDGRIVIDLAD
ncbi:MAG: hypothetical protein HKN82_20410 [Akkermansiaceae bacterium]|nr:hypothetical protein [Akkermansiaceae bacterium]NNM30359.1 hypothetical protein [Akkermansiaceae bacterium]